MRACVNSTSRLQGMYVDDAAFSMKPWYRTFVVSHFVGCFLRLYYVMYLLIFSFNAPPSSAGFNFLWYFLATTKIFRFFFNLDWLNYYQILLIFLPLILAIKKIFVKYRWKWILPLKNYFYKIYSWSGKKWFFEFVGDDDNQNAQYVNGIVKGNDLFENSGFVEVRSVRGNTLSTSIDGHLFF